jgi:hypothetical protein
VWTLAVFAPSGQQLFRTSRNVNAQQYGDPSWQADGSTGELQQDLDVQALTANGDVDLVLFGSSMNVRDALLETTVNAELGAQPKLAITKVEKDTVTPTRGDSTYYSIPRPQANNHFDRWFTLTVSKPKDATITRVRLTLLDGAGVALQTLFEEAPGDNVKLINGGAQIKVRATMKTVSSTVLSPPPPTHYVKYQFVVDGTLDGNPIQSDPKSSGDMNALWRMPDGFARYSQAIADLGGDDWTSKGAYKWLDAHRSLITSINDISGEHARNIGHTTHERGVDIDMFHFHSFTGSTSGTKEYEALRSKVIAALNGDATAKGQVTAWVTASRSGLEALLALAEVKRLYYAIGSAYSADGIDLTDGWAKELIKNGTLTVGSKTIDTATGVWSKATSSSISYNAVHNNHIHISLDSEQLEK